MIKRYSVNMTPTQGVLTLALTQREMALLQILVRASMVPQYMTVISSGLDNKAKAKLLLGGLDNYHALATLLSWQTGDNVRAFRYVKPEVVGVLQAVMDDVKPEFLPPSVKTLYETQAPGINKALRTAALAGTMKASGVNVFRNKATA